MLRCFVSLHKKLRFYLSIFTSLFKRPRKLLCSYQSNIKMSSMALSCFYGINSEKKKKELLKIKTNCSYTQCISGNVERVILYKIAFPTAKKCVLDCQ